MNAKEHDKLVEAMARASFFTGVMAEIPREKAEVCWFIAQDRQREQARAALSAIPSAGYCVMPVEPTEEMLLAGAELIPDYEPSCDDAARIYAAMRDASLTNGGE